ncbi:hypothetical protein ADICEAN_02958 [Cesiribacter andamanensis AMV16]|uniref:Uncharacterized protein n=1 Tax=Cesiribacter andamanensis AMV16 TaxID=1279009 RepID=M7NTU0_9BACT|nr:hypothetical protein ADICEAN_02958 [Cesiribacter andamanensis AMV16]
MGAFYSRGVKKHVGYQQVILLQLPEGLAQGGTALHQVADHAHNARRSLLAKVQAQRFVAGKQQGLLPYGYAYRMGHPFFPLIQIGKP